MASTRELWLLLRARDEASRVINTFSKNVRSAGLAAQAAQKTAEAAFIRQRAQMIKTNSATALQIRAINEHVVGLDKQARALTLSSAKAKEYLTQLQLTNSITRRELRQRRLQIQAIDREAQSLRAEASVRRNASQALRLDLDKDVVALQNQARMLDLEAKKLRESAAAIKVEENELKKLQQRYAKVTEVAQIGTVAFGALAVAGAVALKGAINSAVEYERQVRKTFTQVDEGKGTLEEISAAGIRVANKIGVPFASLQDALFDIFGSLEIGIKDAETLLEQFSKAAVAGQTDIQSASRATIGIMNAFNIPVTDINKILDVQFELVKEGIGSYEEWNTRIGLVTPSAVRAGQSLETMAAALSTATRFSIPASRAATAVSRALDAMSHPAAVKAMKQLGVNAVDAKGKFRPLVDVFRDLKSKLDKLPESKRLAALLEVFKGAGGTIEARRFLQNVLLTKNGFALFEDQIKTMSGATGAFSEAYNTMSGGVASQSVVLNNKFQILKETIGKALMPIYSQLISVMSSVLDWFNNLPEGTKSFIAKLLILVVVISTVIAVFFGLLTVFGMVAGAIATLGSALVPIIAAMLIIPVVIAGIVAGFIVLMKKSEHFRAAMSSIGNTIGRLKDVVVETVGNIKRSFDSNLAPALKRLGSVLNGSVMQTFREWVALLGSKIVPKMREAGRIIKDLAERAFKFLGAIIDKYVTPAIIKVNAFMDKHKGAMKAITSVIAQVAKWFVIIGAVMLALPLAAVVAAFIGIGAVIAAIIYVIKTLINVFMAVGAVIADFFVSAFGVVQSAGTAIVEFFVSLWEGIVNTVTAAGQAIVAGVTAFTNYLRGLWEGFWSTFGGAVKAEFQFIVAVARLYWALFIRPIWNAMKFIWDLIVLIWSEIIGSIKNAWTFITNVISAEMARNKKIIHDALKFMHDFFVLNWNRIADTVRFYINKAKQYISDALAGIKYYWHKYLADYYNEIVHGFGKSIDKVHKYIEKFKKILRSAISGLKQIGKDIINGLIDGITSGFDHLAGVFNWVTDHIPDWKGPKQKDLKLLQPSGKYIMQGFMEGVTSTVPMIRRELEGITTRLGTVPINASIAAPPAFGQTTSGNVEKRIVNNFYVSTQEINPRKTAAELGWELAGRM